MKTEKCLVSEESRNSRKRKQKRQSSDDADSESHDSDVTLSPTMNITFNIGEYCHFVKEKLKGPITLYGN